MHGRHGLALVVFGAALALLRALGVPPFQSVNPQVVEVCYLLALFGFSLAVVGGLSRCWRTINDRLGVFAT